MNEHARRRGTRRPNDGRGDLPPEWHLAVELRLRTHPTTIRSRALTHRRNDSPGRPTPPICLQGSLSSVSPSRAGSHTSFPGLVLRGSGHLCLSVAICVDGARASKRRGQGALRISQEPVFWGLNRVLSPGTKHAIPELIQAESLTAICRAQASFRSVKEFDYG